MPFLQSVRLQLYYLLTYWSITLIEQMLQVLLALLCHKRLCIRIGHYGAIQILYYYYYY